jgi:hypothetical protein
VPDRNLERNNLIYYLRVSDVSTSRRLGYLADISTAGLMLMTDDPLPAGVPYRLRIEPPQAHARRGEPIAVSAVTKWSEKDKHSAFYRTGFELKDTSAAELKSIRRLIKDFLYEEPEEGTPLPAD